MLKTETLVAYKTTHAVTTTSNSAFDKIYLDLVGSLDNDY